MNLKPRMVAALVALRTPRTAQGLREAIADYSTAHTVDLLSAMRDLGLVYESPVDDRWHHAQIGVEWLRREGVVL